MPLLQALLNIAYSEVLPARRARQRLAISQIEANFRLFTAQNTVQDHGLRSDGVEIELPVDVIDNLFVTHVSSLLGSQTQASPGKWKPGERLIAASLIHSLRLFHRQPACAGTSKPQ